MKIYVLSLLTVLSSSVHLFAPRQAISSSSSSQSSPVVGKTISDLSLDELGFIMRFLSPADCFAFQRACRGHLQCLFEYSLKSEGTFFGLSERKTRWGQGAALCPYDVALIDKHCLYSSIGVLFDMGPRIGGFPTGGVGLSTVSNLPTTTKPMNGPFLICGVPYWGGVSRFSCGGASIARCYLDDERTNIYVIGVLPIADALANLGNDIAAQPYQNFRVKLPEGFKGFALVGVSQNSAVLMVRHQNTNYYHLLRVNLESTDSINPISKGVCVGPEAPDHMSLSESGQYAVVGNHLNGNIRVFDMISGELVREINVGPNWLDSRPDVSRLQLSADGKLLLVVGPSGTYGNRQSFSTRIIVYDVASGEVVQIIQPSRPALASIICARFVGQTNDILALYFQPSLPLPNCCFYEDEDEDKANGVDEMDREETHRVPCLWVNWKWDRQSY